MLDDLSNMAEMLVEDGELTEDQEMTALNRIGDLEELLGTLKQRQS